MICRVRRIIISNPARAEALKYISRFFLFIVVTGSAKMVNIKTIAGIFSPRFLLNWYDWECRHATGKADLFCFIPWSIRSFTSSDLFAIRSSSRKSEHTYIFLIFLFSASWQKANETGLSEAMKYSLFPTTGFTYLKLAARLLYTEEYRFKDSLLK